ncbi:MAG: cytochrome c biogenesis protein CcsA [Gemmataceae bacterium]
MTKTSRTFAWVFVTLTGIGVAVYLMLGLAGEAHGSKFDLDAFGRLPVLDHGRVKPVDTLARVSLMVISGKQDYEDEKEVVQPAIRWLLDVMTAANKQSQTPEAPIPGESKSVKAYQIDDPALRKLLGMEDARGEVFSFEEIYKLAGPDKLKELFRQAAQLPHPDSGGMSERDQALSDLASQMRAHIQFSLYETPHRVFRIDNEEVLSILGLKPRKGFRYGFGEFLPKLGNLEREARRAQKLLAAKDRSASVYDHKAYETFKHVELYVGLARGTADTLHLVGPAFQGDDWKVLPDAREALQNANRKDQNELSRHTPAIAFEAMLFTYARDEPKEFNQVVERYHKLLNEVVPTEVATASTETSFNAFAPFYRCSVLYVIAFVVACVSWLWPDVVINRFAFWLMVLTLAIHTWALGERMWIQGRPPVTNLYSSAVFIGWACVVVCVFLEWRFRNALAAAVAGLTGFATLLIAHYLGGSGDTMEMMQAVLDTNFWLATHVTTVTIGYSATFVAGLFGTLFLWMMLVTSVMNSLRSQAAAGPGRVVVFFLASLGAGLLALTMAAAILFGLRYRATRDATISPTLATVTGLLIAGASLLIAAYLLVRRRSARPDALPYGTRFLERFAFTDESRKVVAWMIYGTVCFATLFSFVGTVLGGIWADQSWGRFWGWDPKENGALLIVIMNALILHARWGGMIKDRGMATLTIVGNMITMWSWFGTNQLGIGLHAYGFNNALVLLCRWFWVSQLVLLGFSALPLTAWRSYAPLEIEAAPAPAPKLKGKRGGTSIQPA